MIAVAAAVNPPDSFVLDAVSRVSRIPTGEDLARRNRIQDLLDGHQRREFRDIQITTEDGTITLRGNVSSFYLRQLCIRCCQQVGGVFPINDQLQVAVA